MDMSYEFSCSQGPGASTGTGLKGDYKLRDVGAGNQTRILFARTVQTLNR